MIRHNPEGVNVDYGRCGLHLPLDHELANWVVIEPDEIALLNNFEEAFKAAVNHPVGSPPLSDIVSPDDKIVIVTSDNTRPVPNKILIPAIIRACRLNPPQVTILIGTGSHKPHTEFELTALLGEDLVRGCRVICHDAGFKNDLVDLGITHSGLPVHINRTYMEADKKIVIGYIEPHFFAGYSGGAKGICPAICGLETIKKFHSYQIIADPHSDYGYLENNPQQRLAREAVSVAPPDFLINVTLNSKKEVTGIYAGDFIEAHRIGSKAVEESSMVQVSHRFPIVITSNCGYPLDQNLYQTVKGIWAAARIVEEGGAILVISECSKGLPAGGNFEKILSGMANDKYLSPKLPEIFSDLADRWQVQKLAQAQEKASIYLYSNLSHEQTALCKMAKSIEIKSNLAALSGSLGIKPNIAILPRGPLSIPIIT